jgi:cell filamentation protein
MAAYGPEGLPDPYAWSASEVLRNKWGITNGSDLSVLELSATRFRIDQLRGRPVKGKFDLKHLQAIHRHIFQDVYEWAGELRDGALSRGGNLFAQPDHIVSSAGRAFHALAMERHLKELPPDVFATRLAHHFAEINAIHPFREGNGRALQTFLEQLAGEAGYTLDFSKVERDQWNAAAKESFSGSPEAMGVIFQRILSPKSLRKKSK